MKKPILQLILVLAAIISILHCKPSEGPQNTSTMPADAAFNAFKDRFIEALWAQYPGWAISVGNYKYADKAIRTPDDAARQADRAFNKQYLDSLKLFDQEQLSDNNKIDWLMINDQLESSLWYLDAFKSYEWNPSEYNVADGFYALLIAEYAPLEKRLADIHKRIAQVPAFYEAATHNIRKPTREHTELALHQNEGTIAVFQEIADSLKKANLPDAEKNELNAKIEAAKNATKNYINYLSGLLDKGKKEGDDKVFRTFRIGKDLFVEKFKHDIGSAYTAEQMYEKALAHKNVLHAEMVKIGRTLWPKYMGNAQQPADSLKMVKALIDKIAEKHVARDSFVQAIRAQIPRLTAFVQQKNLLHLDPNKPLEVRETPPFMRGVAGASISSPGPYDSNAPTFYNVTPLDGYSPEKAESYLREYNHYMLQILNIHEAIPGHYAQLVYSNKAPSLIKSILGNGAMVEGWAVYTERMMLEEGYGNNEPEMWLMYYKWNLRVTCNTIIDYGIQADNYSQQKVMDILQNEAFQEQAEAGEKWRRATLSQVQLCSYFSGFREIYDFRDELKKEKAAGFDLKQFHENFLSYGSAPVKYIKLLMKAKK